MSIGLTLLIGIISFIAAFIAAAMKIWNSDTKKITVPGYFFIFFGIVLIILPIILNALTDAEHKKEQEDLEDRLRASYDTSILKMKHDFDNSHKASTEIITGTLGKYGYRFDSLNQILVNIKGSGSSLEAPIFGIAGAPYSGITLTNASGFDYRVELTFISESSGSGFYNIKTNVVMEDVVGNLYAVAENPNNPVISPTQKCGKDNLIQTGMNVDGKAKVEKVYVWVRGNYKRSDGTGKFSIDEVYLKLPQIKYANTLRGESSKKRITDFVTRQLQQK